MTFADRVAINVPPIFLRLALAITFFWAGLGKIMETATFEGDDALRLANMGVQPIVDDDAAKPDPLPTLPDPTEPIEEARLDGAESGYAFVRAQSTELTADDFPPTKYRRVNGLALTLHKAAFPPSNADGETPEPFWPEWAAEDKWPVVLAWAAVLTELLAAVLLLFGFLVRFAGLALAGTMLNAAWLTQIGPAIQAGNTHLGFLPANAAFDIGAWMPLFWQLALFAGGMALAFSGAGALSLDRLGRRRDDADDYEDEDDE